MSREKLQKLADDLQKLSPGDQLRVAAGLLDKGEYDTAQVIARRVVDELTLVQLMRPKP